MKKRRKKIIGQGIRGNSLEGVGGESISYILEGKPGECTAREHTTTRIIDTGRRNNFKRCQRRKGRVESRE